MSIGYYNGKNLGQEKVDKLLEKHPRISKVMEQKRENLTYLCFICRLAPLPFDVFSMLSGTIRMPFKKYLFFSLLGLTPKLIIFVLAGMAIDNTF
jgi:uncharacterized membrane protein YdjX (TVP38/TMEM64 family)